MEIRKLPPIWGPLLRELSRKDVVALHWPGFGIAAPQGFGATRDE